MTESSKCKCWSCRSEKKLQAKRRKKWIKNSLSKLCSLVGAVAALIIACEVITSSKQRRLLLKIFVCGHKMCKKQQTQSDARIKKEIWQMGSVHYFEWKAIKSSVLCKLFDNSVERRQGFLQQNKQKQKGIKGKGITLI